MTDNIIEFPKEKIVRDVSGMSQRYDNSPTPELKKALRVEADALINELLVEIGMKLTENHVFNDNVQESPSGMQVVRVPEQDMAQMEIIATCLEDIVYRGMNIDDMLMPPVSNFTDEEGKAMMEDIEKFLNSKKKTDEE